jgi:predicted ATPase
MLLERGALLGALGQRLDEAVERSGSLVLVAGEAGGGKTSLVRTFVDSLDGSAQVVEGACDPLTTPRPLSPLHDFAADPDFELAVPVRGGRTVIETFTEVLDRLKNPVRPIVVVIEDVHWADEGTLDFVRFVGRRVAACKAVVVCTYRDDEVGPDHPLRPVLGQLTPLPSTHRMVVPPLTIDAVTSLRARRSNPPLSSS